MKFINLGNLALDALLGGDLIPPFFLTETDSMGELVALDLLTNRLSLGDVGVIVDLDTPPRRVREWLNQLNTNIEELEKGEKLLLVDGFTNLYGNSNQKKS